MKEQREYLAQTAMNKAKRNFAGRKSLKPRKHQTEENFGKWNGKFWWRNQSGVKLWMTEGKSETLLIEFSLNVSEFSLKVV